MSPTELKNPLVTSLHQLLRPHGFRKSGTRFSRLSADVIHLIEVQGSRNSSSESARFTVNIGVFLLRLIDEDMREFTKPSIASAHWSARLGFLSPDKRDIWWDISTLDQAEVAAYEITSKVKLYALPVLENLGTSQALIELWQTGSSLGITEYQRNDYLKRLSILQPSAIQK